MMAVHRLSYLLIVQKVDPYESKHQVLYSAYSSYMKVNLTLYLDYHNLDSFDYLKNSHHVQLTRQSFYYFLIIIR